MPVILIIYDVAEDRAYWLYIQYYAKSTGLHIPQSQEEVALHISKNSIVNGEAIRAFREYKESVMKQIREKLRLHE